MGYNTDYRLTLPEGVDEQDVLDTANKYLLYEFECIFGGDSVKWYEHEEDMLKLSLQFPGKTFKLSGEGEENADMWKKEFKDGMLREARATFVFPWGEWKVKLKAVEDE